MGRSHRLASTYADAINVSGKTPEFLHRSVRQRPTYELKLSFKEKIKQQKLPAWTPTYDRNFIISATFILGLICLGIGILLEIEINKTLEFENGLSCTIYATEDKKNGEFVEICNLTVKKFIKGDVMFSYRWNGVHQQHRMFNRYNSEGGYFEIKDSFSTEKNGMCIKKDKPEPNNFFDKLIELIKKPDENETVCGKGINTNFEDEFQLCSMDNHTIVPFTTNGIVFERDYNRLIYPPLDGNQTWKEELDSCYAIDSSCWTIKFTELDSETSNNAYRNKDFYVWQRKPAFTGFRKPYRRLDRQRNPFFKDGLPNGTYKLKAILRSAINLSKEHQKFYPREFLITRVDGLGMRNLWFAHLYITVGIGYIIVGFILLIVHKKCGKTLEEKCNENVPTAFHG